MKNKYTFLEFAESLKLVRQANLEVNGRNIINEIYTDLLPENGVINKINLPRTTILVGRKGTGKSTIFLKSQYDLDQNKENITIYIDAKSLYDSSSPNIPSLDKNPELSEEIIKYLIYSNLLKEIIVRTKNKIETQLSSKKFSFFKRIQIDQVKEDLDKIEDTINDVFKTLDINLTTSYKNTYESSKIEDNSVGASISTEGLKIKGESTENYAQSIKKEFDNTLLQYLDIKKCIIKNLISIRDILNVKRIYIYLDDFSEIEKEAQMIFIDWFIAPINNLSEDFVKFKIATYPQRFYYGLLDNGKIDEINLDFFDAYYHYEKKSDISKMEYLALDYTKRLIKNRVNLYFPNNGWMDFFSIEESEIFDILFKVTLNIPRKMGYILSYCYDTCLIHNEKISKEAIEAASLRYYTEIIEKYFLVNEYVCKPFDDKVVELHHYDLIKNLVNRQVANNAVIKRRKNNFSSHFIVSQDNSYLLSCLELNGFVTTYNKINLKNNFYTVYCLDYGLCKKYHLTFGSPNNNDFDVFFSNTIFNFDIAILDYFNSTQVLKCTTEPSHEFSYSEYSQFKRFGMKCPKCLDFGIVSKCNVVQKYIYIKEKLEYKTNKSIKIGLNEYHILDVLKNSSSSLSEKKISEIIDLSLSSTHRSISHLAEKRLIEYDVDASKQLRKELYRITLRGSKILEDIQKLIDQEIQKQLNSTLETIK